MKRSTHRVVMHVVLAGSLLLAVGVCRAADDETAAIAVLQAPQATVEQKDQACQTLKQIGTAGSVPALASLLGDEQLSQSARLALETMPCAEAARAMRDAMGRTSGNLRIGMIDSLGARRDIAAAGMLIPLLEDADPATAAAAAVALGKIGGAQVLGTLQSARANSPPTVHAAVVDALLQCADGLLANGDARGAQAVYGELFAAEKLPHARVAAYRGMILAAGDRGAAMAAEAMAGADRVKVEAALVVVSEIPGKAATAAFASALAKAVPPVQVALLQALSQRGDGAAAPAVAKLVASPEAEVRRAALVALGVLGDASCSAALAEAAAGAGGSEQEAARTALAELRDPGTCRALLQQLSKAAPAVQGEIVRALGQRQDAQAVPALLLMARGQDPAMGVLALKSLTVLAGAAQVDELTGLLVAARTDAMREAAERALAAACGRAEHPETLVPRLTAAMGGGLATPARAALLRIVGQIGGAEAMQVLGTALNDADPAIADTALRTMANSAGLDAAGALLAMAKEPGRDLGQRVLALRGYWRLAGLAADRSVEQRLAMCQAGLAASQRAEEKRLGLAELSKLANPEALKIAQSLCSDKPIRSEAELACVRIAAALSAVMPMEAKAALQQIQKGASSDEIRAQAGKALAGIAQYAGYITAWSAVGPYRQAGKKCAELFDIPFAPEQTPAEVAWKPLPPPADVALYWQADLLAIAGAEQSVVYARSFVYSPRNQKVMLDIGSDDGIKLWINGKLAHSHNVQRSLAAGSDHAEAMLNQGWNEFRAKITQNKMGCGVCIRLRAADSAPIDGLRFAANPPAVP